mgnify:CR=1 FL=1|tara:strand:- start:50 stop:286 length:237 start_codon:yes stop_codon:yes gene_type:complete
MKKGKKKMTITTQHNIEVDHSFSIEEFQRLRSENNLLRRQIVEETKARYVTYSRMKYLIENQSILLRKIGRWFKGFYK